MSNTRLAVFMRWSMREQSSVSPTQTKTQCWHFSLIQDLKQQVFAICIYLEVYIWCHVQCRRLSNETSLKKVFNNGNVSLKSKDRSWTFLCTLLRVITVIKWNNNLIEISVKTGSYVWDFTVLFFYPQSHVVVKDKRRVRSTIQFHYGGENV